MKKTVVMMLSILLLFSLFSCKNRPTNLEERIRAAKREGRIVMLELGSEGCIACEKMKPVMKKLRERFSEKLEVIFVDVRKDNAMARRYGIMLIPTQVFLDTSGKEFYRHVGYFSYEEIVGMLKEKGYL
ncbi:MAG: thioredoxin [Nitrospirae bacterium]|nr:MAG: thioredoxin [Nitrospirota bacterium]